MDKLKVAVIGCGNISIMHLEAIAALEESELVAVCDGSLGPAKCGRTTLTWYRPDNYYDGSDWKGTWDKEGGEHYPVNIYEQVRKVMVFL